MGTFKEKKRDVRYTIRFTEEESERIKTDMKNLNFLSFSKYTRSLLLKKKVTIQRETITDRSIRNQINEISGKIGKIGVNYNQVVKLLQSLSSTTKKDGRPVINTKIVASQMDQIAKLTKEIKKQQERLIEQVAMVNPEIIPHNDQDIIM